MSKQSLALLILLVQFNQLIAEPHYDYSQALLRGLSAEFSDSLKQEDPEQPIDVELAKKQHETYSQLVRHLVPKTIELPADSKHPDCNFIEDTAIVVGREAVISHMGAKERRGEEIPVMEALQQTNLDKIHRIKPPATMDGGDILYTGHHLFVGESSRTNHAATIQLSQIFSGRLSVVSIPVGNTLHLKSVISLFDENTIVVADNSNGRAIMKAIQVVAPDYCFILVPDREASNVLRVKNTLVIQAGFPQSEAILRKKAMETDTKVVTLNMSELIKADGALTCGSLLF